MANNTRKNNAPAPANASEGGRRRKSKRSTRRKQSGGKSKRGMNPYMKFANKHRGEVMRSMPGAKVPEIGKALGKKWRSLSDAEKKSYA